MFIKSLTPEASSAVAAGIPPGPLLEAAVGGAAVDIFCRYSSLGEKAMSEALKNYLKSCRSSVYTSASPARGDRCELDVQATEGTTGRDEPRVRGE